MDLNEDLIDALMDLKHDLGKHIRLPLAMLPRDADDVAVREAVRTGIHRTRRGPTGDVPAAGLWERFLDEAGADLAGLESFGDLAAAVERALKWGGRLEDAGRLPRAEIEHDLDRIGPAVAAVIEEVRVG